LALFLWAVGRKVAPSEWETTMAGFSDLTEVDLRTAMFRTVNVAVRGTTTSYVVGNRVMLGTTNLCVYECIAQTGPTSGTANTSISLNTTLGSTTVDGGVTWLTLLQGYPKRPIYVSLHTGDPLDTGLGTECAGGGYLRVSYDPSDANWTAPDTTSGITRNALPITFPSPSGAWGLVGWFGLWDSATAGRFIIGGALNAQKTINASDPAPLFPASSLVLTFD
jgi:hypothetical protein